MNSAAILKDLGNVLQQLTDVKADTLRLIVPQSSGKGSKLLSPFSDEQSSLSLQETSILETIRMMGVSEDKIDQVLKNAKVDQIMAGFDEEDRRLRLRMSGGPRMPLKLSQGNYIFCDFRTLHIPGVELNPPASKALRLMHRLVADHGIVVFIMSEMAPVGYVGVSPKCILGYNKNCGEEKSLRLRTDNLKGFRKHERIKTTLLHELPNQEATNLDWTKSRSHCSVVSGLQNIMMMSPMLDMKAHANARASSVAAAYRCLADASAHDSRVSEGLEEPNPVASGFTMDANQNENLKVENPRHVELLAEHEPDPDELEEIKSTKSKTYARASKDGVASEPDPDDSEMTQIEPLSTAFDRNKDTRRT
ncbi:WLM domain [Dillenia turbinata]|uniref:WLM domain n=1 Tax=Dillenia turbinata TaxID=194707 RepID=A0AAN8UNC2_9MAGN